MRFSKFPRTPSSLKIYVLKSVSKDPSFRGPRYWRKR